MSGAMRGLIAVLTGPVGLTLGIAAAGYGVWRAARYFPPFNEGITSAIGALRPLPGVLGALSGSISGIAGALHLIPSHITSVFDQTNAQAAAIDAHIRKTHATMQATEHHNLRGNIMHALFGANPNLYDDARPLPASHPMRGPLPVDHRTKMDRVVHIEMHGTHFNFPKGTPKEHAHQLLDNLMGHAQSAASRGPGTLPTVSRHALGH